MITTYSQFILNETLKTNEINLVVRDANRQLSLLRYKFEISINQNNTISVRLLDFNLTQGSIEIYLDTLINFFINRHGWFPSIMNLVNIVGSENSLSFDQDFIVNNFKYIKEVEIIFEAKFDVEKETPKKLYHLSIQEFLQNVERKGLVPKSKSKLSKHLDRIYLCEEPESCRGLIGRMKIHYLNKPRKSKINDKWVIYEIDTDGLDIKLYKDPNYTNGYYSVSNIPAKNIKVFDKE